MTDIISTGTVSTDGSAERSLFRFALARSTCTEPHLLGVAAVHRDPEGVLVVRMDDLSGTPLTAALDRLGVPSVGLAVTLTAPLLDLATGSATGAVVLGDVGPDDVLVDDAGTVVVVDRPPGAAGRQQDGTVGLVIASRLVWERTDPREPCRADVDAAFLDAVGGAPDALARLSAVIGAAAVPRPVRWQVPDDDLVFPEPESRSGTRITTAAGTLVRELRLVLSEGVELGARRLPLRRLFVAAVVLVGVVVAALTALDTGGTTAAPVLVEQDRGSRSGAVSS